jgi:hypothetical protein
VTGERDVAIMRVDLRCRVVAICAAIRDVLQRDPDAESRPTSEAVAVRHVRRSCPASWGTAITLSACRCARSRQGLVAALRRRSAALRTLTAPARSACLGHYVMAI